MSRRPFYKFNKTTQYFISILMICLVGAICYILSPYIGYKVVALILLVTVSVIAMLFDILPVLVSATLSALIWNYFFIHPTFTFSIDSAEDALLFVMYFIIALVNGVLTYKIRQMEKQAFLKEEKEHTLRLYNTLFNSLSHELHTPIATIIGATDTLKDNDLKLSGIQKHELVNEISIASLRLYDQVSNLLNMSRLETGHLQLKKDWCDISELVYSAVNKLTEKKGNRKIEIHIPDDFPLFKLDFGIMEQVLHNLLHNAIQYTQDDAIISISTRFTTIISGHFPEDATKGKTQRDSVDHTFVLTVSDNGKGFPEEEVDKAFDKFYRLSRTHAGGTGLGLSIVKGFVEAHKGKIRLRNLPEGGSEFTIEIPSEASYLNSLNNE